MKTLGQNNYNTQTFGMYYKSPKKWGEKTLHTFIKSDLRKSIDEKYQFASASCNITNNKDKHFPNNYPYSIEFTLKLNKRKTWKYKDTAISSPQILDEKLAQKLKSYQLNKIEEEIRANRETEKKHCSDIKFAKKENKVFILKKIMDLFNIDPKSY